MQPSPTPATFSLQPAHFSLPAPASPIPHSAFCILHFSTLLASHPSPLAPRPSPLAPRPSPLASRPSPLASRPSPLAPRLSPLASRPSPLAPRLSPHQPAYPRPFGLAYHTSPKPPARHHQPATALPPFRHYPLQRKYQVHFQWTYVDIINNIMMLHPPRLPRLHTPQIPLRLHHHYRSPPPRFGHSSFHHSNLTRHSNFVIRIYRTPPPPNSSHPATRPPLSTPHLATRAHSCAL
jgi:hypothetical protein